MQPARFQTEFAQFEEEARRQDVRHVEEERRKNAENALRIARFVKDYDRTGFWPHRHAAHDNLVTPMRTAQVCGLLGGAVFAKLTTEQFISEPTLAVELVTIGAFFTVSKLAEAVFAARWPIPAGFEQARRGVVGLGIATSVPIVTWLLMRVPGTPFAAIAEQAEGIALVAAEATTILFAAAAGAAAALYRWSRDFEDQDTGFRNRLIALGAETADIPQSALVAEGPENSGGGEQ